MTEPLQHTIAEATVLLGYSERTIYELINSGQLATVRVKPKGGGERDLVRIERTEIDAFLKRNRTPVTTP